MCSYFYLMLKEFKNSVGVFPCDRIPSIQIDNEDFKCVIINTNKYHDESTCHWLLVTFFSVDRILILCEIFD